MDKNISSESLKLEKKASNNHITAKEQQIRDIKVFIKFINWVLSEDGIVVKDFIKDLKDGKILVKLASRLCSTKENVINPRYHKNIKDKSHLRENFEIAFNILRENNYKKETSGISAEDFEKDESGDTESIDFTSVLGFFWQLMLRYQKTHFKDYDNLPVNLHIKQGMSKYEQFLAKLETFISLQLIGKCWEINKEGNVLMEKKDNVYELNSSKCYCLVGVAMVKGEKENCEVFIRFGKDSTEEDRIEAINFANTLIKKLGKSRVLVALVEEGFEIPEWNDYLGIGYDEDIQHSLSSVDPKSYKGISIKTDQILDENEEMVIDKEKLFSLSNSNEVILMSNEDNQIDHIDFLNQWKRANNDNKPISITFCNPSVLPVRIILTLEQKKKEEEESLHEQERLEKERLEKERLEKERLEKEILEKERLEKERLEKERLEKERLEKERLEKERLEKERLEKERLEKERLEKERLEKERLEKERLEKERLEKERLEKERLEKERLEKERLEKERLEKERLEKERLEKERLEKERLEKERLEKERLEKERLEKERLEKERLEKERLEKERLEKERLEKERLEKERLEKERLEKERLEKERLEKERLEKERLEKERLEKERLEKERLEKERLEKERLEKERLEKERLEKERLEKERLEKERLEKERLEKERLEKERLEKERLEKERLEKERLEKERLEKERLEKERLEKERLEKERLEKERLEKERLERERKEREERERKEREEREERERKEREEREEILLDNKKVFANKYEEDQKGKEIFEKLKKAIKENDLPLFKQILQQADEEKIEAKRYLDLMDENNMGLLHLCAFHNRHLIATELINKGADVDLLDDTNQTPLYVAASRNSQETLDVLLNSKKCNLALADLEENTALHVATNLGFENLVKSLLNAGANPNQPNSKGDTPVHIACFADHPSILNLFTSHSIPTKSDLSALNHKNQVPLHFAVERGNLKSVKLLIDNGSVVDCVDLDDRTPMWIACEKGNYDVEVCLRKAGCNLLWSNNEGETYLHVSSLNGHLPIVKDLVNEGKLKKNLRTFKKKETPIFYAARNGHIEVIKFLLEEDDINVKNDDDENFVDVARRFGHGDLINQLDLNRARSKYWIFPWLLLGITVFTIYRVTTKKKDK